MKKILIAIGSLLLIAGCTDPSPDIVIINIDDMGWRDVGFMGSQFYSTPNIDALAEEGIIFTNAYASASNCAPSRACLMSGQWTPRHGIYTVGTSERGRSRNRMLIPTKNNTILPDTILTLAESMRKAGYTTFHAGKWHLGEDPRSQGFDINIGGSHRGSPKSYYPPYGIVPLENDTTGYLTDNIMKYVLEFVHNSRSPFFLHYSPYAIHTPIHPVDSLLHKYEMKEPSFEQSNVKYATMIDNLDRNIGLLIDELKSRGSFENTLIIFTTDNGGHFRITRQRPLRSGKGSYYEGGIRVPMAIIWKEKIKSHAKSNEPVTQLDLYPTLIEVAGLKNQGSGMKRKKPGEELSLDGISLLPHLLKSSPIPERTLFWHFPIYLEAYDSLRDETRDPKFRTRPGSVVRKGDWKLHEYFEDGGIELYNLKDDISESENLIYKYPERAEELLILLQEWRDKTGAPIPSEINPDYIPVADTLLTT